MEPHAYKSCLSADYIRDGFLAEYGGYKQSVTLLNSPFDEHASFPD
jgi:hypothetical protein